MAFNLGVNFFVNFYDLNPFTQRQCIYFTKKGTRCRWNCHENARARVLHRRILASNSENLSTEDIIEYLLCNCCTYDSAIDPFKKVEHRDWIEDAGLVLPLANRWRGEILARLRLTEARAQVTRSSPTSSPAPTLLGSSPASTTYGASAASTPNRHSVTQTPITDPSYYHTRSTPSFGRTLASPSPQISPTPAPRAPGIAAISNLFGSQAMGKQSPYSEGSSVASSPTNRTSSLEDRYSQPLESEFRPHMARPSSNDTVAWIMRREPRRRDNETGFIYIFDRDGSPGHVKIGWTAVSVQQRLEDWSKHGYTPRLVFETERIPNAQRAETLMHYELITEWRRELRCRNPECDVKHQEWFEVNPKRAKQVVGDWVQFFKKARPFDDLGYLKKQWIDKVNEMNAKGEAVTSARMLAYHEALLHSSTITVQNTSPAPPTQSVKQESVTDEPEKMGPKIVDDIAQVLQTTLDAFKKESLLAHQEFMRDLRSTQDQFMERLKSIELTVGEPATPKPAVETAKSTAPKRRIKVRIPKPKEEWVVSSKEKSALPASPGSKSLSELRLKQSPSPVATTISVNNSLSHNGVAQDEKLTAEAQPLPTQPVSKGDTDFEANRTPNFKSVNDGGISPNSAFGSAPRESSTSNRFSSGGSLVAKEEYDTNETLSAKPSHFKLLPPFKPDTFGRNHTSFGASLTPESKTFGTETKFAQGKTSFSGAASIGTKGFFGGITSTEGTSLFGTKATSQGSSLFGSKTTPADGTSLFGTKTTSTENSLFGAKAMPTGSPLFDTKAASTSLFSATATSTGGFLFGTKAASAGGSVFGGKSTSEGSLFGNKASTTVGSLFGTSTTTTQGSLSFSEAPPPGSFILGIKATSAFSESSSLGKTTSAFTTVPSFAPTAPSTSKSSLFGTKATFTQGTSLFGTGTTSTTPFSFRPNATTPSTHKLAFGSETSFVTLSSSVSKPPSESEGSSVLFPKPSSTPNWTELSVYSVNTSSKNEPFQGSKTPLKEPLSTTSSPDAVLMLSKTRSIFDSQIKKEFDGFKSDVDSKAPIGKDMLAPQKVSQGKQMQAIVNKEIFGKDAPPEPLSITNASRTSTSLQLEGNDLDEQDVEADKSEEDVEEQNLCEQDLEEDRTPDEEDLDGEEVDEEDSEESLESHINEEDVEEEGVEEGTTENGTLGKDIDEEDQEEDVSDDISEEDVDGGDARHDIDDKTLFKQESGSYEPAAQSQKEATLSSDAKSIISDKEPEHRVVSFCEVSAVDETQTPLVPEADTLKIVERVTGTASLLDAEVKTGLDVAIVVTSEALPDTGLVLAS